MSLNTVQDYISAARGLLQDTVEPFRYPSAEIVLGLNLGFLEARRLRPDLFIRKQTPAYSVSSLSTTVDMPEGYRTPLLYYICGHVQLRDDEPTQDARATVFLNKFVAQLQTSPA
jgi:hypothetical protein